ncbi:MAG TPA: PaaI family thioesterase [Alphaproteobacteria bacterium]|nr:PaaI family thioesterase [Alphaproteobacteria bacterium]
MPHETPSARSRQVSWHDPLITAKAGHAMAGLDFLKALVEGKVPPPPITDSLGFTLSEVSEGVAVFTSTPAEYHYNPIAVVHGGLAATLIDSATGCAVHSTLPLGMAYTTVNLGVDFLRPITTATGPIRCEGRVVHRGSRIAIAEGKVIDAAGKVYAQGKSTCMIFKLGG